VDAASRALEPAQPTRWLERRSQHVAEAFTPIAGYDHILQHLPKVMTKGLASEDRGCDRPQRILMRGSPPDTFRTDGPR
jgi:hypothetical protein